MVDAAAADASGGEYIYATTSGYAEYSLDIVESKTYYIWGRAIGTSGRSNSFYVTTDNGDDMTWHLPIAPAWNWSQAVSVYLEAGRHILTIKRRETGAQLDKMLITNDPNYIPQGLGEKSEPMTQISEFWFEAEAGDLFSPMEVPPLRMPPVVSTSTQPPVVMPSTFSISLNPIPTTYGAVLSAHQEEAILSM